MKATSSNARDDFRRKGIDKPKFRRFVARFWAKPRGLGRYVKG